MRRGLATLAVIAVAACHNPSRDDKPSPEFTSSPPVPPSPPSPSAVTTSGAAGEALARTVDAAPQAQVRDGAVACSVTLAPGVPAQEYTLMNTGNLPMKECTVVFYAYDARGKQVARKEIEPISRAKDRLEPTQSVRGMLDPLGPVTWEAVVTRVRFADGSVWSDPSRAPTSRRSASLNNP